MSGKTADIYLGFKQTFSRNKQNVWPAKAKSAGVTSTHVLQQRLCGCAAFTNQISMMDGGDLWKKGRGFGGLDSEMRI